jgi:hypothetical protein
MACVMGLNFNSTTSIEFLTKWNDVAVTAFPGAWWNSNNPDHGKKIGAQPIGPPEVCGHRHDQTAASIITYDLGMEWTEPHGLVSYNVNDKEAILLSQGM